jgi:hypothetical protein
LQPLIAGERRLFPHSLTHTHLISLLLDISLYLDKEVRKMPNVNLGKAKTAKFDEFYTLWDDIEREMNAYLDFNPNVFRGKTVLCPCDDPEWSNFTKYFTLRFTYFGMKKLISTSYAVESKNYKEGWQLTMFEKGSPKFNDKKTRTNGKIFVLDGEDVNKDGKINIDDLKWEYMEGDGDFRGAEVKALRDEADIIITNPPFSLFREFLAWLMEAKKQFLVIANMNAITYKEVFPLIKENKLWLGVSNGARSYLKPDGSFQQMGNTCWFTNIDHGRRHEPLMLMKMKDNLKHSKHKEIKGKKKYDKYDNYNALEVPYVDAIPADYEGVMGVPISFLDKYCPEQFEILGATESEGKGFSNGLWKGNIAQATVNDNRVYKRLFIKNKRKTI